MTNTPSPITPHTYLGYRDAQAALDWLEKAFGFRTLYASTGDDGTIKHAEVTFGDAAFMIFPDVDDYDRPEARGDTVGVGTYFAVGDAETVDALYSSGVAAGGVVAWEPAWTEWGNYRVRLRDPEGREWTFGTHRPGAVQEGADWSADTSS
jgi:uncharacterized glyoxalase superfamily protein PhnB